jgi:hypothetical protein
MALEVFRIDEPGAQRRFQICAMMQVLSAGGDFKPLKQQIKTGGCTSGCLRLPGPGAQDTGFIVS